MSTITVRFVGQRTTSWVGFVNLGNGPEVRVSLDPANPRPWRCAIHGRQTEPDCPCTDVADAANELRRTNGT